MKVLSRIRIVLKLPLIMVAVTALAIATVAWSAYRSASKSVSQEARERLSAVAHDHAEMLRSAIEAVGRDLYVQSHSALTLQALRALSSGFSELDNPAGDLSAAFSGDAPDRSAIDSAGLNSNYDRSHAYFHPGFRRISSTMDYGDLYLVDIGGNVVYSVSKSTDFAVNLLDAKWKNTSLGAVFRDAMARDAEADQAFADFSTFAPADNQVVAFVARPVLDESGTPLGALVYQVKAAGKNSPITSLKGFSDSAEVYVAGDDGFMRTDSPTSPEIDTMRTRVSNPALTAALAGESGMVEYIDRYGQTVLAYYAPVGLSGVNWALIAKENVGELFAPVTELRRNFLLIGAATLAIAAAVSVLLSRSIARPLAAVGDAMGRIGEKRFDTDVPAILRGDEIGQIAQSLESFRQSLKSADALGREAAFKSSAFEEASAAMMMVDEDFRIVYVNRALESVLDERAEEFRSVTGGLGADELIGINMDRFHKMPDAVRQLLSRPENLPLNTVIKIGSTFFSLSIGAVRDDDGRQMGFVVQWKNETKLLRDATIIAALDSHSARIEITQDNCIGWANVYVCKAANCGVEELLGLDAETVIHIENADGRQLSVRDIIRSHQSVSCEIRLRLPECELLIDGMFSPMKDPQGKPNGTLLVGSDVTEERALIAKAEAERNRNEQAQAQVVENLRGGLTRLSQGDLTVRLDEAFQPEYEQLRSDFNMATGKLLEAVSGLVESAASIHADTSNISSATQSLSKRTETQAATLEETAAALDQLTGSVQAAAEDATTAARMVTETRQNVETSGGVVHQAVGAMGEIEKFSNEISSISSVIDEIAFQTNLLALNAGVEAARAGEAGRGFAVVASEVRALAQRSSDAAREINSLITSSGAQIKKGVTLVSEAGEVLNRMMESVVKISDSVEGIAQGATDQSRGLQEINSAVNQLDQVTQHNAAMFEQTSAASIALAGEAESLTRTMSQFRVVSSDDDAMAVEAVQGRALRVVHGE